MVENPFGGDLGRRELEEFLVVEKPANLILLPFNGIDVEIVVQGSLRNRETSADSIPASIGSPASRYSCSLLRRVRMLIPSAAAAWVRIAASRPRR